MNISIDSILQHFGFKNEQNIGVAFSGGGARGFSHIGVLMAMQSVGIKPEIVSGVSAGAIASVLYASGLTPQEMIECFSHAPNLGNFTELTMPKEGFMKLERFGKLLESWLPVKYIEDLRVPTVICATDFDHGKAIGWNKGEIVPRVLASCSIPVIFNPIKIDNTNYVDGGVLRNLPAWAIRPYCKTLFGSNCSPLRKPKVNKYSIIDMAYRSFHLMMKANTPQDIKLCDHVIEIHNVSGVATFDLSSLHKGVMAGYEAAMGVLTKINIS